MQKNSQMIEQIFANIDAIGAKMEGTVDLSSDVVPFMSATLAKIKQLALAKADAYEAQYELFQIATNYLPRTIDAYCALPIEYRNTRVIKFNKNARQLLVEDLKIIKKQVQEIEKQFYAGIESQIKVNSSLVREKYDNKFQLATEIDQVGEDGFVNQFDFSTYKNSNDYKSIQFKKESSEKEIQAKERSEKINKVIAKASEASKDVAYSIFKKSIGVVIILKKVILKIVFGFLYILEQLIFPIFIIGFCGILFGGLYWMISSTEKPINYLNALAETSKGVHEVMSVNLIPTNEFAFFVTAKEKEMIDDSGYREERAKVFFNEKTRVMTIDATDLNRNQCLKMIDYKEKNFDAVNLKVNGMSLPQDKTVSNSYYIKNENHKLCHLEKENKVTIELNNQNIYDYAKNKNLISKKEAELKIANMQKELEIFNTELVKYGEGTSSYYDLKSIIKQIEESIAQLKSSKFQENF